jgi:hypothetical protein
VVSKNGKYGLSRFFKKEGAEIMNWWKTLFGIKGPSRIQASSFLEAIEKSDLDKVSTMLREEPRLLFARWDKNGSFTPAGSSLNSSTALRQAAARGKKDIVRLLLANGAHVNDLCDGSTILNDVASRGYQEVAELLLDHGAKLNVRDGYGYTPLHSAAYNGHAGMVELLIARGADGGAKGSRDGKTAWDLAVHRNEKVEEVLRRHGKGVPPPCPRCGSPFTKEMRECGIEFHSTGWNICAFAVYDCPHCSKPARIPVMDIEPYRGIVVLCRDCRRAAHIPGHARCALCGNGLSPGWQKAVSKQ